MVQTSWWVDIKKFSLLSNNVRNALYKGYSGVVNVTQVVLSSREYQISAASVIDEKLNGFFF